MRISGSRAKKDFTREQLKETVAYQAMSRIGILYKIEDMIYDKTPEEKYEEHQKQSRLVMNTLFEWLHTMEDSVDSSSLIGDAILYTLNQKVYLRRYLEDGHLSIDNNSAERALKNFAVGRRNCFFQLFSCEIFFQFCEGCIKTSSCMGKAPA